MVLLTMTPAMVAAIEELRDLPGVNAVLAGASDEPSLAEPKVGNPISQGQVIDISRSLRAHEMAGKPSYSSDKPVPYQLDNLLRGSRIYNPPPAAQPEPVSHSLPSHLDIAAHDDR